MDSLPISNLKILNFVYYKFYKKKTNVSLTLKKQYTQYVFLPEEIWRFITALVFFVPMSIFFNLKTVYMSKDN